MKLRDEGYMTSRWWLESKRAFSVSNQKAVANRDAGEVTFLTHVMDDGGLRIAPHGRLTILISGERDPDWRHQSELKYGVLCRPVSDLGGELFCPHTKKAIPASRFAENYIAWVDKEFGVAVVSGNVSYEVPDGPPIPFAGHQHYKKPMFKYSFANRKRYKVERERVEALMAEAKLRMSLADGTTNTTHNLALQVFECALKHPDITTMDALTAQYSGLTPDAEKWGHTMHALSLALSRKNLTDRVAYSGAPTYDDKIKEASADHYESDYLEWREPNVIPVAGA